MEIRGNSAPGGPGIPPRWTSSAKSGMGTAVNSSSLVWFTLSHGIFNEIYYPRIDRACTRDMGLVVTDGEEFFSEEKRHTDQSLEYIAESLPAFRLVNRCKQGRYVIEKQVVTDPERDVVLQHTRFKSARGSLSDYHLHVLLAPHLGNQGSGNTAWVGEYKGVPMLFAERSGTALALACSVPWLKRSVGFVGFSDGWQDLHRHKEMRWAFERAENGNVCLTGEISLESADGSFLLALGFGSNSAEAGHRALASLLDGFQKSRDLYIASWESFQRKVNLRKGRLNRISAAVLRTHSAKNLPGGIIASLSIPWGVAKGDKDLGGYHLVWPRDLVEAAGGLMAAGVMKDVRRIIHYIRTTQEDDGHWPQNMWIDGTAYWGGLQMDETAFPILLVDNAWRQGALESDDLITLWPMIRRASSYLARNGPVSPEDRWEEDPGYSPFTLAVEVAALLCAAEMADLNREPGVAQYLREKADAWNANVERWTYVIGTDLARRVGVDGYYIRIAPKGEGDGPSPRGFLHMKTRPPGRSGRRSSRMISPDALALVRFGLRSADDPRILNTLKVIDSLLRVETPNGPAWYRYNGDEYGEHEDGTPYDGKGKGRLWPLLTGERGHFELSAGRREAAERMLRTMEGLSSPEGLIPEQIWDEADIPEKGLFFGRPSGSAMPLVWAHAEYLKLCRSLQDGRVFDTPPQTRRRYVVEKKGSPHFLWSFANKARRMDAGKTLRLEVLAPAVVHWSSDGWQTTRDMTTWDTGLGLYIADLPTGGLEPGCRLVFTFYWPQADHWEGEDFTVLVE